MTLVTVALTCSLEMAQDAGKGIRSDRDLLQPEMLADSPAPVIKEGEKVALTGKLNGGMMAIGGETTGWRLTYSTGKGKAVLEVDMSAIKDSASIDGKEVKISGSIILKSYVERGAVLILKAGKVEVTQDSK